MSYMNNNTETRKNKHLNERERYAIGELSRILCLIKVT
ncbi:hypothetical protein Cst_c18220 [Thermoclostridium stercorarium subsp. stercorarium DSM 8532]|uniref:Uncharacterized protein n=1 Tax=Thermoclostridium stercorarium (strain ATCC 35414 / DSM 8532 / NCIMB 11754) TaxID=1121335 RepID=L7VKX9_THES1|nr:hypothetical protein Cst_c18220 [Thermoclostridium stercorarium subsp. stercorarium DSM 8532]AGI39803.1 hypothetical protein Clst_1751 [Thermoclostridium stercorarium subsp. stercorarium DSM 8532]